MPRFFLKVLVTLSFLGLILTPAWTGQALLMQGMQAQKAGHNAEALKLLNEYIDRYPQVAGARYYRALALNGLGRKQEALEDVDKALADNPGSIKALYLETCP